MQDNDDADRAATQASDDGERYDPLRIALRSACDAFDPDRAVLERRAATAPLIWYIEDTPDIALGTAVGTPLDMALDMALGKPGTRPESRVP